MTAAAVTTVSAECTVLTTVSVECTLLNMGFRRWLYGSESLTQTWQCTIHVSKDVTIQKKVLKFEIL
jgi:hypothetical protein